MRRKDSPARERHEHHRRVEQEVGEVRRMAFPRLHSRRIRRWVVEKPPDDARHGEREHRQARRNVQHQSQKSDRRRPAFHEKAGEQIEDDERGDRPVQNNRDSRVAIVGAPETLQLAAAASACCRLSLLFIPEIPRQAEETTPVRMVPVRMGTHLACSADLPAIGVPGPCAFRPYLR